MRRLASILLAVLLGCVPALGAAAAGVELPGTWHVLIHYTDDNTASPDAWRWDDRVWVFEMAGTKLRWSEYPIVVFQDQRGRFGPVDGGRVSRIIHAWEPNPDQEAQIRRGLEVNPRGRKSKTLKGSDEGGWASRRRRASVSASVITYQEHWSIEGLPGAPVFQRADMMGSAMTESMEGLTRYAATEVSPDGSVVKGTFERDGTRHGRFTMRRAGQVGDVKGSGKTQGERLMDAWFGEFAEAMRGDSEAYDDYVRAEIAAGRGEALRDELRSRIRTDIERAIRRKGLDPRDFDPRIDALTVKVEKLFLEEGKSASEISDLIERGEIEP